MVSSALPQLQSSFENDSALPGQTECESVTAIKPSPLLALSPIFETEDPLVDDPSSSNVGAPGILAALPLSHASFTRYPSEKFLPTQTIAAMPRRTRLRFYLKHPDLSSIGWTIRLALMTTLLANIAIMIVETMDGPRYDGSDPKHKNYVPKEGFYVGAEIFFTSFYVFEFLARLVTTQRQEPIWRSKRSWLDLLALSPTLVYYVIQGISKGTQADIHRHKLGYLRLLRIVRLSLFAQVYDGSKVMAQAIRQSIAPLMITLFFLITVVMVFATAIFYAEPCYDLHTCAFTDIFNAGYYVVATVATVGYGNQLPSLNNPVSVTLSSLVMIFGQLYLAMPLAIVGVNYENAWRDHENRTLQGSHPNTKKPKSGDEEADESLQALDTYKVRVLSTQVCDRYYFMAEKIREAQVHIFKLLRDVVPENRESMLNRMKARNEIGAKVTEIIASVRASHRRVCTDIMRLIPIESTKKDSARRFSSGKQSLGNVGRSSSFSRSSSAVASTLTRARRAFGSVSLRTQRYQHIDTSTWQSKVWNILEHNDVSTRAVVINRCRLIIVLLSIALFMRKQHQNSKKQDFTALYAGCFVLDAQGQPTTTRIRFNCPKTSIDTTCYGNGFNYGSELFSSTCVSVFGAKGELRIGKNRLCEPPTGLWMDMEPSWMSFEFIFGVLFTIQTIVRVVVHPVRRRIWKDFEFIANCIALFPFYVELGEIMAGITPIYSIVPTAPSFFSMIRVLKAFRILKLGAHIPGSEVLTRTAVLVHKRLIIPLFFLFVGSVICGAVFFEIERGKECFVGKSCMWWGKNVLTPAIAHGHPDEKRILEQNTAPVIITDMLRSTWLALETITTVGYGDLYPRTMLGRLFATFTTIMSACYTAMPLTLVGRQFYSCYEAHSQDKGVRALVSQHQVNQVTADSKLPKGGSIGVKINRIHPMPATSGQEAQAPWVSLERAKSKEALGIPAVRRKKSTRQRVLTPDEEEALNHFVRLGPVLDKMTEDLGKLTRVESHRVSQRWLSLRSERETNRGRQNEHPVEWRISDNLTFAATLLLSFTPIVEKVMGFQDDLEFVAKMPPIEATQIESVEKGT